MEQSTVPKQCIFNFIRFFSVETILPCFYSSKTVENLDEKLFIAVSEKCGREVQNVKSRCSLLRFSFRTIEEITTFLRHMIFFIFLTRQPSLKSLAGQKQGKGEDEGVFMTSMDAMNGFPGDVKLTLDESGQGQSQNLVSPPSQEQTDSKYEFDPISTGSSSAPLSPPETTESSSGMFVDFDGVAKHVHEASTASVSPQSPQDDPFALENKENSDPMTSSMIVDPMTSSFVGDPMTSSFVGDFLPDSSQVTSNSENVTSQICDYNVNDVSDVTDDVTSALPPGSPVSIAALREIGVYGAPPPEEGAPVSDLVCLDEDGMQMPTTQAPTVPPNNNGLPSNALSSNIVSDSLINTHAPMGQFDPFKAEVNGSQSVNPFDSIPGQPPIGFTPPLQPKEAFVDPALPLVPSLASTAPSAPSAPGGPVVEALMAPVQATASSPPLSMPPKNEPLFQKQPLPDVANVKVTPGSGGQQGSLLLEDVKTENEPSAPVVPPIDLSSFDPNAPEVKPTQKSSPKSPASPTKKSQEQKAQAESVPDSTKIPSPKRAKPAAAKQNNATTNNKAPTKKISPTSTTPNKSEPAKSPRTPSAPEKQSPRGAPPAKPSPRGPVKKSPRATKGFHNFHTHAMCVLIG